MAIVHRFAAILKGMNLPADIRESVNSKNEGGPLGVLFPVSLEQFPDPEPPRL
jgi:hypothetical protein